MNRTVQISLRLKNTTLNWSYTQFSTMKSYLGILFIVSCAISFGVTKSPAHISSWSSQLSLAQPPSCSSDLAPVQPPDSCPNLPPAQPPTCSYNLPSACSSGSASIYQFRISPGKLLYPQSIKSFEL